MTEKLFEEWLSYPDKRIYVPIADHSVYANQQGWWSSGWQGDDAAVAEVKARPRPPLVIVEN